MFTRHTEHTPATTQAQPAQPAPAQQLISYKQPVQPTRHVQEAVALTKPSLVPPTRSAVPTPTLVHRSAKATVYTKTTSHTPATTRAQPLHTAQTQPANSYKIPAQQTKPATAVLAQQTRAT